MNDFRYAFRQLVRSPGFTATAILTLALGIGLNAAMFNIVNSIVLAAAEVPRPRQSLPAGGHGARTTILRIPSVPLLQIARESGDFAQIACSRPWSFTLSEPNRPADGYAVAEAPPPAISAFWALKMELGREFLPDEDQPGREPGGHPESRLLAVALRRRSGNRRPNRADRRAAERDRRRRPGDRQRSADLFSLADIYRPLALNDEDKRGREDHAFGLIGRFLPGINAAEATTRLAAIAASLADQRPEGIHRART